MQIPTVEQVRESLPFKNIVTAMDRVFPEGWITEDIYPDLPGLDFVARFTVRGYSVPIYIHAIETHTSGMYASGPGGFVGVSVPWPGPEYWRAPDGTHVIGVDDLIRATGDKSSARMADGADADAIESLLYSLRRYLDGPPVEHKEPTVEQVRSSLAFTNVGAAMARVFPEGWVVEAIYPQTSGLDFVTRFRVAGYNSPFYVKTVNTGTIGLNATPGGRIGIFVPWSGPRGWQAPDGRLVRAVPMTGTAEERKTFMGGAAGADVDDIEALLRFLRRHLNGPTGDGNDSPNVATNTQA